MKTRHVIKLRDIIWSHKTYEDWCVKEDSNNEKDDDVEDNDSILVKTKAKETVEQEEKKDTSLKVIREMKKLQGWFNPDASRVIESSNSGLCLYVYGLSNRDIKNSKMCVSSTNESAIG